jgi:hypothetical protein
VKFARSALECALLLESLPRTLWNSLRLKHVMSWNINSVLAKKTDFNT